RFAWFAQPDPQVAPLSALLIKLSGSAGAWTTADRVDVPFANYALRLLRGNAVALDGSETGLTFTPPGSTSDALVVSPVSGGKERIFPLAGAVSLPLLAGAAGCLSFSTASDHAGLTDLDVGIRYFITSYAAPGYVDSQRYPVFDLLAGGAAGDATALALGGVLDPVDPQNENRSFLTVAPATGGAPLRTYFRNPLGEALRVAPRPSAKLVFRTLVTDQPATPGAPPAPGQPFYLTPCGDFTVQLVDANALGGDGLYRNRVMAGLAGAEYVSLAPVVPTVLSFEPNGGAYAPATYGTPRGADPPPPAFGGLTASAATAWATMYADGASAPFSLAPANLTYYAQPDSAVMHGGDTQLLAYRELRAGSLPPPAGGSPGAAATVLPVFPLAPYAGSGLTPSSPFRDLEVKVLSPTRRAAMPPAVAPPPVALAAGGAGAPTYTTTPQGLLLELGGDESWQTLTLAQSQLPGGGTLDLQLNGVRGALKDALQSNQLFLVISDAGKFLSCCSPTYVYTQAVSDALAETDKVPADVVQQLLPLIGSSYAAREGYVDALLAQLAPYVLDAAALAQLASAANVPAPVIAALQPLAGTAFATYAQFQTALAKALSAGDLSAWGRTVGEYAAHGFAMYAGAPVTYGHAMLADAAKLELVVQGYTFDLSPYRWDAYRTVLIFKFLKAPLGELVADATSWSHAADFNGSVTAVQQQLAALVSAGSPGDPDLRYFLQTVVGDPNWNGVLALNARVPLDGLPQEIEGLAAGIDAAQFGAHHVGVSITPVVPDTANQKLKALPSSMFGLIDYESPEHLSDPSSAYGFKVLKLTVLFANSAIVAFASKAELLANQLFGEAVSLNGPYGNVLDFTGTYLKNPDGTGSYLFANSDLNVFGLPNSAVFDRIVVSRAQFVTLSPASGANVKDVSTKFLFAGTIGFKPLPGFDVLSFGTAPGATPPAGLAYSNLSVDMDFDVDIPAYKTFRFDIGALAFDVATSRARPDSLYAHFPLKLTGLVGGGADTRPDKASFMPVDTPLAGGGGLSDSWYALTFSLNLGTPGALAAQIGFDAGFVAAWSPSAKGALDAYVGLSIPGVKGGKRSISLQGVLTLAFGDIGFIVSGTSYILELRAITLSVLSLTFPPTGQTSILLFGDPKGSDRETLGWYAGYAKSAGNQQKTSSPQLAGLEPEVAQWAQRARRDVVALADILPS
ncbi:MAG: hypothetical protein QOI11_1217, partial [Candidatus Eremiobacteraeota bacterium]|nr:hypothetical protein [Candidatus Eremiobacteraeota bacterium]